MTLRFYICNIVTFFVEDIFRTTNQPAPRGMFKIQLTPEEVIKKWNLFTDELALTGTELPKVRATNQTAIKNINAKLKQDSFDFDLILDEIRHSDFLQGKATNWRVTFDWIFAYKTNWIKIINQTYRNANNKPVASSQQSDRTGQLHNTAQVFQSIKDKFTRD